MAKSKQRRRSKQGRKSYGRKRTGGLPPWAKTGLRVGIGAVVGLLATPFLPESVSGLALGVAGAGVATGSLRHALPLIGIGLGLQGAQMVSGTKVFRATSAAAEGAAFAHGLKARSTSGGTLDSAVRRNFGTLGQAQKSVEEIISAGKTGTEIAAAFA